MNLTPYENQKEAGKGYGDLNMNGAKYVVGIMKTNKSYGGKVKK